MNKNLNIKNRAIILFRMIRYNLKIIFGNRFIWFLLASFGFFVFFSVQYVTSNDILTEESIFNLLLYPGVLLIFYPTVFGIQNDDDSRMLEILFGIPNYRYKVWLVRIIMIFILVFAILLVYGELASVLLLKVSIVQMAYQLMYPIVFLGGMSFMFSTVIKSGNGTAVVMVLIGVALLILSGTIANTQWNVFLNPFRVPENLNLVIWDGIVSKNRIFLGLGMVVFILYGMINLQKREKFI